MAAISRICLFNGTSLETVPNLTIAAIDNYGPERTINISPLARRNARNVSSAFYQKRTIYVSIWITSANRATVDQAVDTLLSIIQGQEGTLTLEQSGTTRLYTCTFSKIAKNNTGIGKGNALPPQGGYADFTLEFECSDSYGYDNGPTLITNTLTQTTSSANFSYTQGGGAEWQVPKVQVRINSLTGGSSASVTIGNLNNGQAITINRTWSQYDMLVVDSRAKTVQVNGVDVIFTGAFPEFNIGAQTLTYNDTFSTRSVEIYANVVNRWN